MRKNKFTVSERNEITSFLERAFVRLEAWFQWFNTTQSGIFYVYHILVLGRVVGKNVVVRVCGAVVPGKE